MVSCLVLSCVVLSCLSLVQFSLVLPYLVLSCLAVVLSSHAVVLSLSLRSSFGLPPLSSTKGLVIAGQMEEGEDEKARQSLFNIEAESS